jgi:hypothetical protein
VIGAYSLNKGQDPIAPFGGHVSHFGVSSFSRPVEWLSCLQDEHVEPHFSNIPRGAYPFCFSSIANA